MNTKTLTWPKVKKTLIDQALILAMLAMIIAIIIIEPAFLQWRVLKDILTQSSIKLIVALGLLFPLLLGGTDLAGGRQVGLAAVIVASMTQTLTYAGRFYPNLPDLPVIIPIVIALIVVAIIGMVNGWMIAKLNMAPFIATFGMSTIVYGINCLYFAQEPNRSQPIGGIKESLTILSSYKIFGISMLVYIALIITIIVWFVLNRTVYGKHLYIVGGNKDAAKVSGVNVALNLLMIYALSGVFYAFGGLLEAGRIGSATNNLGFMYELDAIAACVVGGVSFSGGVGTVFGVVTGVIIFTVINYGLTYIGVNPYWQYIIKGAIIIFAVALDSLKYARKK